MRLIDADALLVKQASIAKMFARSDAQKSLMGRVMYNTEHAPTIPAIPVEWLRRYTAVGVAPTGNRLTEGNERLIVHRILNEWQQEQEAR